MIFLSNTHFQIAISSLRRNRGRSFLSALGIAIGVAAIVVILSLTGGVTKLVGASTDKANSNLILVRPDNSKSEGQNLINQLAVNAKFSTSNLELDDLKALKSTNNLQAIAPIASTTAAIKIGDKAIQSVNVVATTHDLPKTTPLPLKNGVFLNEKDPYEELEQEEEKAKTEATENKAKGSPKSAKSPYKRKRIKNNVAVIGSSLANRIFGSTEVLTNVISYNDQNFIIVGVLEKLDDPINYNGIDFDNALLLDINYTSSLENPTQIQQFNLRASNSNSVKQVASDVKNTLSKRKDGDTTFQVITNDNDLKSQSSLFSLISGALTSIASISLLIGGIGIMNIMLVSVSERTREIGIRKAVGATSGNILLQFLYESVIISSLGGIMGIILGYFCAFIISMLTPFKPYISLKIVLLTIATSLLTGIIFGIYPAAKAARKEAITSLKEFH